MRSSTNSSSIGLVGPAHGWLDDMARHAPARPPGAGNASPLTLAMRRPTGIRLGVGAMVVLLIGGLVAAVVVSLLGTAGQTRTLPPPSAGPTAGTGAVVYVHVLGEVLEPGVFQLRDGDRVIDAIAAAGGFTATADQQTVNLARFLSDGEQILVPAHGAAPTTGPSTGETGGMAGGKVNLNTASSDELETLPRVGPAMAERIIAWRDTNGRFSSVDDLLNVTGIGDKTFEALRDLVTV